MIDEKYKIIEGKEGKDDLREYCNLETNWIYEHLKKEFAQN